MPYVDKVIDATFRYKFRQLTMPINLQDGITFELL